MNIYYNKGQKCTCRSKWLVWQHCFKYHSVLLLPLSLQRLALLDQLSPDVNNLPHVQLVTVLVVAVAKRDAVEDSYVKLGRLG